MPATDSYVRPTQIAGDNAKLSTASLYLMHLLSCALRGKAPVAPPEGTSWDAVFKLATNNSVTTTCAFAVAMVPSASGEERKRWQAEVDRNLMRHAMFDMEREAIFAAMDEAGLAHLPLKGIVTSREYPRPEMRWMCDNDVLFGRVAGDGSAAAVTASDARKLRSIMTAAGYKTSHYGEGNHDAYEKAPFLNMEMHRGLANPEVSWWRYYESPWTRARRDEALPGLSYTFSREDAYLFHVAHMFKHFSNSGHGVRGIGDEWVLMQAWGQSMDRAYLDAELTKLGMLEFEGDLRHAAASVIGGDACGQALAGNACTLGADDRAMLAYMLGSGTYGSVANRVTKNLAQEASAHGEKGHRARYLLGRAFPSKEKMQLWHPVLVKAPWLLPAFYVGRLAVQPFTRTARLRAELSVVAKAGRGTAK